jgi:membrane fusion protein (multidrug efflux system)
LEPFIKNRSIKSFKNIKRKTTKMKTQNAIIFTLILAVLAACGGDGTEAIKAKIEKLKQQQSETKAEIEKLEKSLVALGDSSSKKNVKIKEVAVSTVAPKEFRHFLEIQGKVDSDKNVLVSSLTAGTIMKILVNRGDNVKKGSVLAIIDDDLIKKGIGELQTNIELAKTVYEKQKNLWDQKIGTEVQYLQSKATYESLKKKMDQLEEQQSAYRIKATIDGTVDEIYPNEGEITAPGQPFFRIVNTSGFKVIAEIGEGYINKVKKGNKVLLYFPDIDYTMETYVKVVSDVISPVNRTFLVEFELKNTPPNLKANMLTYVKILDYSKSGAIVIPVNTIQHSEAGDFVYTVKNKKAVKTNIKTGAIYRTDAEIISGLSEGDQIITVGYQDMTEGQEVKF